MTTPSNPHRPRPWPETRPIAVSVSIMLEAWTDDSAPGLGPMGNPLRAGVLDTQGRSWAEYGPKVGTQRLLDVLDDVGAKAVVYCSGMLASRYPALMREIVQRGHSLAAHAWAQNIIPAYQTSEEEAADLRRTVAELQHHSGAPVTGWISPRATPSVNTPAILAAQGMHWYVDAFDQDLPYIVTSPSGRVVAIPFTVEVNDFPLYIRYGNRPEAFTGTLQTILEGWSSIGSPRACLDITVHAHVFGRPMGAIMFKRAVEMAQRHGSAWLTTHAELAQLYHPDLQG